MNPIQTALLQSVRDIEPFSKFILKRPLRDYQLEPARAAIASVIARDGEQYVWRFPRQSGKNETLAHVHAYLLFLYQRVKGASIIHTAPTYDTQAHNALLRVLEITAGNPFFANLTVGANVLKMGLCRATYLSGAERDKPNVGSTASLLLSKDECQDLNQRYIEQAFDPMTANTNAPHVHTGTARHDGTYLALKKRELDLLTQRDAKRRVFIITWHDVARCNEAYRATVTAAIARKGALHPSILTEYENVETERTGRLFDERRLALIFSDALPPRPGPQPECTYVCTIDVGGTDLQDQVRNHDMTVCTIHQVTDASGSNRFDTVDQFVLSGGNVLDDSADRRRLFAYIDMWHPVKIVTDATGLGTGLASALLVRYSSKDRVLPFTFTAATKTQLINDWLALVETGRYHHFTSASVDSQRFRRQLERCEHEQHGNFTQWGIPAHVSWRHPITLQDEPLHDDHMLSAALVAVMSDSDLRPRELVSTPAARRRISRLEDIE